MKIEFEIKDIGDMRYETVGDYYYLPDGTLKIEVADTGTPFFNMMVLVHELIELALLEQRGIPIDAIDEFDMMFEKERGEGLHELEEEPGFDTRAPYGREHTLATSVEMLMCAHAGVNWIDYNDTIINL